MEIELSRLIRSIQRFWSVALLAILVSATLAVALSLSSTEEYTARTSVLIATKNEAVGNSGTVIELSRSDRVLAPVLEEVGVPVEADEFSEQNLSVTEIPGSSLVQIEVTFSDPDVAAEIANGVAAGVTTRTHDIGLGLLQRDLDTLVYERDQVILQLATVNTQIEELEENVSDGDAQDRVKHSQLREDQLRLRQRQADLNSRIRSLELNLITFESPVIVNYEAVPPTRSDRISPAVLSAVGAVVGALVGFALMLWLELRDPNVRDEAHVRDLVPAHSFMRMNKDDVADSTSAGVGLVARRVAGLARTSESENVALVSPRPLASSATLAETLTQTVPLSELNTVVSPGILESLDGTSDISPATTALLIVEKETTRAQDLLDAVDILRDLGVTSMSAVILE